MIQLAEGASVTQTAHRCGWSTTSAFIDTFARTMGQTPGAYQSAAAPAVASQSPRRNDVRAASRCSSQEPLAR
jgi:AraC-like DNA-binding protein